MKDLRLKSLILHGFKSFADKTTFDFHDGMTILVGPNGCGKSNIVDAIKWVLGDQSAKSVRGKEMTDVIFNGSGKRPPMGLAEVSLVFDNRGRILPLDLDTVMISRRIYRSGESEYSINGATCRLRDIKETFMDTGIGVSAYSLIEQGRVASFIQANAKERRFIFEEAAGISRLKARKKEAQAKLNRSQQNMERLHDIVEEVSRRLARVRRQAQKAQKYRELSDQLKEKRVMASVLDYNDALKDKREAEEALMAKEQELASQQSQQSDLDARRSEIDEALEARGAELAEVSTEIVRLDGEIQRLSDLIEINERRCREIETAHNERTTHHNDLNNRLQSAESELNAIVEKSAGAQENVDNSRRRVERSEQLIEEREESLLSLGTRLEEVRSRLMSNDIKVHRLEQMDIVSGQRQKDLEEELSELSDRHSELNNLIETHSNRSRNLKQQILSLEEQKETLKSDLASMEKAVSDVQDERNLLDADLADVRLEESRLNTERRLLEDLQRQNEGLGVAVKGLLAEGQEHPELLSGIIGMAADLITAPAGISRAVDSVLGPEAQTVVVDNRRVMEICGKVLEDKQQGRVAFMSLDALPEEAVQEPVNIPHAGRLIDRLSFDDSCRQVFELLLGKWWLVNEETDLTTVPGHLNVVTPSGRRRDERGRYVLGPARDFTGLVSRRSALSEMASKNDELKERETRLDAQLNELDSRERQNEASRSAIASRLMHLDSELSQLSSEQKLAQREAELADERQRRLDERRQTVSQELNVVQSESQERTRNLAALRQQQEEDRQALKEHEVHQEQELAHIESLREELVALRMEHATLQHEWQNMDSGRQQLEEVRDRVRRDLARHDEETKKMQSDHTELSNRLVKARHDMADKFENKQKSEAEQQKARQAHQEVGAQKARLEAEVSKLLPSLRQLQQDVTHLQVKSRESSVKVDNLVERVRDEYDLDLIRLSGDWEDTERDNVDLQALKAECQDLKKQIEKLGNVNLEALQEEGEQEERYAFLRAQEKDLREAIKRLEEVVSRIDTRARETFVETYEKVRENFKVSFRQLFGGGRADLRMEEGEDDVLEAGIDITACPPGKEPRSITLLSGGEKTMTAVALLFAIFRSRPSPFCVLDEVDAALDESNIDRWLGMLAKFTEQSQFLVVTHNKRTMRAGAMIYGVTMQEPGVSKKLSLKFEELDQREEFRDLGDDDNKEVA